jgi:hypothetical protein
MADPNHVSDAADADAEAYQHGKMAINEQAATWALVQTLFSWGSLSIASLLLFLVIWFQPGGSFFGGFIAGVVVFVAGFFFLKSGKAH